MRKQTLSCLLLAASAAMQAGAAEAFEAPAAADTLGSVAVEEAAIMAAADSMNN